MLWQARREPFFLEPFDLHRRQATSLSSKKKVLGITSSLEVLEYFKGLAEGTGFPYQKLVDLILFRCKQKLRHAKSDNLRLQDV
jgi:hypothetical protein